MIKPSLMEEISINDEDIIIPSEISNYGSKETDPIKNPISPYQKVNFKEKSIAH